jgi:hypothetical protein
MWGTFDKNEDIGDVGMTLVAQEDNKNVESQCT